MIRPARLDGQKGLEVLCNALRLKDVCFPKFFDEDLSDSVIIAIDFENCAYIRDDNPMPFFAHRSFGQMGIAKLDTRDLFNQPRSQPISTFHYTIGPPGYISKTSSQFQFGSSVACQRSDLLAHLKSHLPDDRPILLIGHNVLVEVEVLAGLGFIFPTDRVYALDTEFIARTTLGKKLNSLSLKNLLRLLGCPYACLHCAGNDAHFTLRAALLLAKKAALSKAWSLREEDNDTLALLHEIAKRPLQGRKKLVSRNMMRRIKIQMGLRRWPKSKKCDLEKQERVRAERRALREEQETQDEAALDFWDLAEREQVHAKQTGKPSELAKKNGEEDEEVSCPWPALIALFVLLARFCLFIYELKYPEL